MMFPKSKNDSKTFPLTLVNEFYLKYKYIKVVKMPLILNFHHIKQKQNKIHYAFPLN